jgi:acetoacetyl-CoA synthetase
MDDQPLWRPAETRVADSHMRRFLDRHAHALDSVDYAGLHAWSIAEPAAFWSAVKTHCAISFSREASTVVAHFERMPGARWFEGAELNYAENLLRDRPDGPRRDGTAIVFVNERGERDALSWADLRGRVAAVAASLEALGVGRGDRVAGFLPNRPEAVVAALAAAAVGAVWSSCSAEFGVEALADRFGQIEPKVLFAADGYFYNGKTIDCLPTLRALVPRLRGLAAVVVIGYAAAAPDLAGLPNAARFAELAERGAEPRFTQLPFDHPLFILYSSGTTGRPKCIVHGAGGTLIQHQKEHVLHTDIGPDDVVFYFTTCGWMMWNWLLSALACGATIVLYDGSPFHPDPGVLWRMAERERVTVFGTSAKYLSALESSGYRPRGRHDLDALGSILSTGSPLAPASFDFVYEHVAPDVQLASIAGGTDLISCFVLGNPLLPVYRGEIQSRGLGMDVRIFDARGREVVERKGELVCASPFPSMPVAFWDDPDGSRYRRAYFERFPGVWCHGDYAELTRHGGIAMYGRSDAVLNPGGVRIGTAEIYRIVEELPEVAESIVIGQEWDADTRIVLFVKLARGAVLDEALAARIKGALRREASPRHVPAKILEVPDIPRTMSGKIVELAVRDVVHGRGIENAAALANPEALQYFRDRPELGEP